MPSRAASIGARNWRTSLGLQRVGVELVSNAADGDDQLWGCIVPLDPLPQAADVDVDRTRLDVHVLAPDQVQQLEAVVNAIGVADEELEQLELAQREAGGLSRDEHLVRVEVHPQSAA